jgi:Zn-finger nucleic acid-binding protein
METKDVKGVAVDLCTNCAGVWLDSGGLKEITRYDLGVGRVLTCMRCETPMQTKMLKGVEIDICPECSSIWLDGGELKDISGLDYSAGRVLTCPNCSDNLQTKMLKGVEVDICPKCSGAYLDKGEMEKLSAVEQAKGTATDIGQFLKDANKMRMDVAVRMYNEGKFDKGKAAEVAGVNLETLNKILKEQQ